MEVACSQQKRPPCGRSALEIPLPWGQLGQVACGVWNEGVLMSFWEPR